MIKKFVMLSVVWGLVFAIGQKSICAEEANYVSLVQIIANPQSFDGQVILVEGYATLEFENMELYLHREDAEQGLVKNGVWIDLNRADVHKYSAANLKYVIIEGVFDSKQLGHNGSTSGTITKVRRLEALHTNPPGEHPAP